MVTNMVGTDMIYIRWDEIHLGMHTDDLSDGVSVVRSKQYVVEVLLGVNVGVLCVEIQPEDTSARPCQLL